MKKLISLLFVVLLMAGCSSEGSNTFDFTLEDYEERVNEALNQMDIGLSVLSSEENEDGRQVLVLSDDVMIFVDKEGNKPTTISLAATSNGVLTEDIQQAFVLLVGTVDDSLNMGQRSQVVSELGLNEVNLLDHTEVYNHNDIQYTFKGTTESVVLQAEPK